MGNKHMADKSGPYTLSYIFTNHSPVTTMG